MRLLQENIMMRATQFTSAGTAAEATAQVPPIADKDGLQTFLKALSVARGLNHLIPEHEFTVMRDPRTKAVVVAIRYRSTGELIDVRPPDTMLDMLEHLPGRWRGLEE
jgi:hypothetical protein